MTPFWADLRALWRLALPLAVAQAGQATMGLVDTAVVGHVSAIAQGGAGLGNSLTFTVCFFGMGVLMGVDPQVAQALGAGQPKRARTLYWVGVWLAGATSLVLMAVLAGLPAVLGWMDVSPDVAAAARTYMWWRLPGIPAQLLFVVARGYLQCLGQARTMVWAMVLANLANAGLDVVLVFGAGPIPTYGVAGAAVATSLVTWLQFGVLTLALPPSDGPVRRFDGPALKQTLRVGLPIGLHLLAESGVFSVAGLLAARLGDVASASHQVALNWASLTFCVAVGIGSAAMVRVGWAVGAGDTPSARRSGFVALASGAAFMGCTGLGFLLASSALAQVMSSEAAVVALASSLLGVTAVFQVSDGLQAVGAGALRGAGDTRFVFWANVVGHWAVGLPLAYVLGVDGTLGVVGVWWGLSAGLTAVAVALVVRFALLTRRDVVPLHVADAH
ncbi:MAG: MATE family efflux transporter [Archangium sp.]|nr:MATE family efflux transporter [Archangium sp.]